VGPGGPRGVDALEACDYLRVHAMHLGSIFGASGDYATAKVSFAMAAEASFEYLRHPEYGMYRVVAKDSGDRLRKKQGNHLQTTIDQGLLGLRLSHRMLTQDLCGGDAKRALEWYAEAAPFYVDLLKERVKGRLPVDLAASVALIALRLVIYARAMGLDPLVRQGSDLVDRLGTIHEKHAKAASAPGARPYRSLFMIEMAKALIAADGGSFLENFRALASAFPAQGDAPYFNVFRPDRALEFLQASAEMGAMSSAGLACLPPAFDPQSYWGA
jgi:hypothetical protein